MGQNVNKILKKGYLGAFSNQTGPDLVSSYQLTHIYMSNKKAIWQEPL